MIVYFPFPSKSSKRKTVWRGPYFFRLSEMIDPLETITKIMKMGGYIELEEEGEEELALQLLRDLEEPFKKEFKNVVDAYFQAKRILNEIAS